MGCKRSRVQFPAPRLSDERQLNCRLAFIWLYAKRNNSKSSYESQRRNQFDRGLFGNRFFLHRDRAHSIHRICLFSNQRDVQHRGADFRTGLTWADPLGRRERARLRHHWPSNRRVIHNRGSMRARVGNISASRNYKLHSTHLEMIERALQTRLANPYCFDYPCPREWLSPGGLPGLQNLWRVALRAAVGSTPIHSR